LDILVSTTKPTKNLPFSVWLFAGILLFAGSSWLFEFLGSGKVTVYMAGRAGAENTGLLAVLTIALPLTLGLAILGCGLYRWWLSRKRRDA
jgi:hypothetical protein